MNEQASIQNETTDVVSVGLQAINSFCREVGITRSDTAMHLHKLEHHIRADLEASSPRLLAVLRPLKITLTNLPADYHRFVKADVRTLC